MSGTTMQARRGRVEGVVQGVGFRPFVAGLARGLGLSGFVENLGGRVELVVAGPADLLDRFAERLVSERPPAARIESLTWERLDERSAGEPGSSFAIRASSSLDDGALALGPDLRICSACLAELDDPSSRRSGYALNACTACGPRLTLTRRSPWSRAHSAMAGFEPCGACRREFDDPGDRRWHAEAIACPRCGPQLWLEDLDGGRLAPPSGAISAAAELLRRGQILGLRGVGGFQLLVDARCQAAVERLRARKRRPHKPLALMVETLDDAAALVELDPLSRRALSSAVGPIVLAPRRAGGPAAELAPSIAAGQPRLGLMVATTAAHALVLRAFAGPVVATSGNVHERPIARSVAEARTQLDGIADALLVHDRPIVRRCDDSLVQVVAGELRVLRLARGLAPARFELPELDRPTLALGAHLQHTPAFASEGRVLVWPYVGDLDEAETRAAMGASLEDLCAVVGRKPARIVCDMHPDYATTLWAEAAQRRDPKLQVERVFHHHAHVAAVLAEHRRERALGVAWDGAGLGEDRSSWGGEFLVVEGARWRRVASLRRFGLVGGDAAARDGLRVLAGMLVSAELPAPELADPQQDTELARFMGLAGHPRLSPATSAVGRLFDGFAALVGLCFRSRYQAEAACALEHAALAHGPAPAYPFVFAGQELDWRPMLAAALAERDRPGLVAARVHATLVAMILAVVSAERPTRVALAGGCFANTLLLGGALAALRERGVEVLAPARVPPGDGGLALGQAWIAAKRGEARACA